jgi:Phosphate-selective porin O and P
MIKKYRVLFVIIVFAISILPMNLNGEVKFKGLFQSWLSYAPQDGSEDDGYGFTLRRMRFKPYGSLGKNISWTLQVGWDKQKAALIDAYIDYKFSDQFKLRVGQFSAPGTVSGSLTPSGKLDLVERAMVSQQWGGLSGLSGYRGMGIQAHGDLAGGKLYYALMLANPRTTSLFTPSLKSATYGHDENGLSAWARLEAKPVKGLRIGAFFGNSKDDDDYVTNSYGAHFFYIKNGINFKVEYIGGKYGFEDVETKYNGLYALLGYKIDKIEPILRFDIYTPNDGMGDGDGVERYNNLSLGINYFHNKTVKFQVNYVIRSETMSDNMVKLDNNLFYLSFQFTYN